MKPTSKETLEYRSFLRRQSDYEKTYSREFYNLLRRQYRAAAKVVQENGDQAYLQHQNQIIGLEPVERIYRRLYMSIMIREARLSWNQVVIPALKEIRQQKDIMDELAGLLGPGEGGLGRVILLWRRLINEFIEVRILTRIQSVSTTTKSRIAAIIEENIREGIGPEDIARQIRKEATGEINVNRSRLISRTETISAMNQGKFIAMKSSGLDYTKKWITTVDGRTRDAHLAMYDSDRIDLNEEFIVGGEPMAYPGDPRGSGANVCNCRCTLSFRVKRNQEGNISRRIRDVEATV